MSRAIPSSRGERITIGGQSHPGVRPEGRRINVVQLAKDHPIITAGGVVALGLTVVAVHNAGEIYSLFHPDLAQQNVTTFSVQTNESLQQHPLVIQPGHVAIIYGHATVADGVIINEPSAAQGVQQLPDPNLLAQDPNKADATGFVSVIVNDTQSALEVQGLSVTQPVVIGDMALSTQGEITTPDQLAQATHPIIHALNLYLEENGLPTNIPIGNADVLLPQPNGSVNKVPMTLYPGYDQEGYLSIQDLDQYGTPPVLPTQTNFHEAQE